jgi:hypothetical protein
VSASPNGKASDMATPLPSLGTCQWCEEAPATVQGYDEHNGPWSLCDECNGETDVARCPACGDVIDYCQGHGEIGDPMGHATLAAHDDGQHDGCHPDGCDEAQR